MQKLPKQGGATFPVRHRLERLIWSFSWMMLGNWTPVPFFAWRRMLVRVFGGRIHHTAKIYPGVKIWYPKNLVMEEYSCLGPQVNCYCMDVVSLEQNALVSQRAHLCCGTHNIDHADFQLITSPITIGRDAWVCAEAFVGPGVHVEPGAVLGARGVAVKNLETWTVYAGNPAKLLRKRAAQEWSR